MQCCYWGTQSLEEYNNTNSHIYYLNKQTIGSGTREMNQYLNQMQKRNDFDYIIIHFGTNDAGKLCVNEV